VFSLGNALARELSSHEEHVARELSWLRKILVREPGAVVL
jgi:hypothetical protein